MAIIPKQLILPNFFYSFSMLLLIVGRYWNWISYAVCYILACSMTYGLLEFDLIFPDLCQLIVTVGEDCTCRMWGLDGKQLQMTKEHM